MGEETLMKQIEQRLNEKIEVEELYLFGSRAKGTFRENSDYDIAVISRDFKDRSFKQRQETVLNAVRKVITDKPVEVLCYTPEEFEKGKDGFIPEIIDKEGVRT
jgi:predicted nucleotidyltransferase